MKESFIICFSNNINYICQEKLKQLKYLLGEELYINVYKGLVETTSSIVTRVLLPEYNLFKETKENNFEKQFKDMIEEENYIHFLYKKYPLLEESLKIMLNDYIKYVKKVFNDFKKDKREISLTMGIDIGDLKNIITGLGDLHNGVSTCKVITNNCTLFYKPRGANNEKLFYNMIDYITNDTSIYVKKAKYLNKDEHMWMQEIPYKTCTNIKEVKDYYYISGIYLFIFYIMTSYDMHYENIINNGSTPVIIDFETLTLLSNAVHDLENKDILNSVLNTMYLPYINENGPFDVNLSGILSKSTVSNSNEVYEFDMSGDDFTLNKKKSSVEIKGLTLNNEDVVGKYISLEEIRQLLLSGFKFAGEKIINRKDEFVKLTTQFMQNNVIHFRQIIRPTQVYVSFINAIYHPSSLTSIAKRDEVLNILLNSFKPTSFGYLRVENEIETLKKGYVPEYYSLYNSKALYSNKEIICDDYFNETVLEKFINKMSTLNMEQIVYQQKLIDLSLISLIEKQDFGKTNVSHSTIKNEEIDLNYVQTITKEVIDNFKVMEIKYDNNLSSLLAPHLASGNSDTVWVCKNLSKGIYEYGGVILLCAYYAKLFSDDDTMQFAFRLLDGLQMSPIELNLSVYTGEGGLLYLYYMMHKILKSSSIYAERADAYLQKYINVRDYILDKIIEEGISSDSFDYIHGKLAAVCLICKIALYDSSQHVSSILSKVEMIEKMILESEVQFESEIGLAHGLTGICVILSSIYKITKSKNILKNIEKLLLVENKLIKDFGIEKIGYTWCRGLTGIALGRDIVDKNISDQKELKTFNNTFKQNLDLYQAVEKMLSVNNMCLCHGVYGNIEILRRLGLENKYHKYIYHKRFRNISDLNWLNNKIDIPLNHFMLGNSGVAYALLSLFFDIPSILSLDIN